jgi:hypothetical protein
MNNQTFESKDTWNQNPLNGSSSDILANGSSSDVHLNRSTDNDTMTEEDWFGYITEGLMLTSISTCGFIGNTMSIWVLLRSSLRGNFSYQLTSLAG